MDLRLTTPYSAGDSTNPAIDPATNPGESPAAAPIFNLEVAWKSPWREFGSSFADFFTGPRPAKDADVPADGGFRVDWVGGRLPGTAFAASSLWHVAAILILILPIWGFLPQPEHTLPPVQIEVTYVPAQDLPRISLPAPRPKREAPAKKIEKETKNEPEPGADAYHPRQTILSVPVQVTHPRQTLIQPDAPKNAPKIDAQLPNMVQWDTPAVPKPQLQLSPTAAAPTVRQRVVREVATPDIANSEKNPADINIASTVAMNSQPKLAMAASSAAVAVQRQTRKDTSAAPEVGGAASDENLHRIIALSATPGPPAPEVKIPQENLAARVSISPDGKRPGTPGGAGGAKEAGGTGGGGQPGNSEGGANAGSLPAAISVSGGNPRNGGIAPALNAGKLNLKPAAPDLTAPVKKGPSVIGTIPPGTAPESILAGKEVYKLNINLPNFTSVAGSWVVSFAQLDESSGPPLHPRGQLSGPVPLEKVDPKYPPDLIKDHVEGEVVLYAIIRKDGSVDSIQVVHSVDPQLDKDAKDAFARWKFRPGAREGEPVDLEAVIYIPFRYRPPE
jgi:TonB family protein